MIVPAAAAQDSRITADLLLPEQPSKKRRKKKKREDFGFKVTVSHQKEPRMDALITAAGRRQRWISRLEHGAALSVFSLSRTCASIRPHHGVGENNRGGTERLST